MEGSEILTPYRSQFARISSNWKFIRYRIRKFCHPYTTQIEKNQLKLEIDRIDDSIRAFSVNKKCNICVNMQIQSEILQKQWESI